MSRLSDLLRQVEQKDPQLAADLAREVKALSQRRQFGLNFERHTPETVELYGRPIRKGDKVRFLAPRGESPKSVDQRLWKVVGIARQDAGRVAKLVPAEQPSADVELVERAVDDLVVVAEFRDPIYPGLVSTGKVERSGDKPFHTVINAENFHALQLLLYTHEGKVDAIYIDPPYNTGAKDWKYNNDYVDAEDAYRHSKWLAFMERRLKLARRLLDPKGSVLIITIDEKEYLRLGLLLEQTFPEARIQMVTSVIAQKGVSRTQQFYRTDEYIFFVQVGGAMVTPQALASAWQLGKGTSAAAGGIVWSQLRRSGTNSRREDRPTLFYPLFIDQSRPRIHSVGEPLPAHADPGEVTAPHGTVVVWPIRSDGAHGNWQQSRPALLSLIDRGYVRVGQRNENGYPVSYLKRGSIEKIESGKVRLLGKDPAGGHVLVDSSEYEHRFVPGTSWNIASHDATYHGTQLLSRLIGQGRFPFPKSLYAVEDALRFFVGDKPEAIIVDFFAGSGTAAHAVMRLNHQDGGRRVSICVTNNEVSADEQGRLWRREVRPADPAWEELGICEYVTKPRITAAVTGRTPDGAVLDGDYKFVDEFPMAEGFEENVEFFTMSYEAPRAVAHHRSFEAVAPLLWLKAGAQGRRIERPSDDFVVADAYGVLFDTDYSREFLQAMHDADGVRMGFIVTDDDGAFQMVCAELPAGVEAVRLYSSYLTNFMINAGRE
ncbi:MAG: DNA methyltransferase [Conexibacter sp.]